MAKPIKSRSRISKSAKSGGFKFRWWMGLILVLIVAIVGLVVLRFSKAAANTKVINCNNTIVPGHCINKPSEISFVPDNKVTPSGLVEDSRNIFGPDDGRKSIATIRACFTIARALGSVSGTVREELIVSSGDYWGVSNDSYITSGGVHVLCNNYSIIEPEKDKKIQYSIAGDYLLQVQREVIEINNYDSDEVRIYTPSYGIFAPGDPAISSSGVSGKQCNQDGDYKRFTLHCILNAGQGLSISSSRLRWPSPTGRKMICAIADVADTNKPLRFTIKKAGTSDVVKNASRYSYDARTGKPYFCALPGVTNNQNSDINDFDTLVITSPTQTANIYLFYSTKAPSLQ